MTSPRRPARPSRSLTRVGAWLLALLAAVGLLVLSAGTASAATLPDGQTRVRASSPETITAVGVSEHIAAGQGRGPPVLRGRFVVATGVAAETAGAGDARYLYRGLAEDHPGLADAKNGIARPRGGHADPARHNGGNTLSEFTSWTTDESIARGIAAEASGPGAVLRIPNADGLGYVRVPSPDVYGESEVLIRGPVTGADVLPWEPTP